MRAGRRVANESLFLPRGKAITSRANFSFPGTARLKARKDFLRVRECGRKVHSAHFLFVYAPSDSGQRIGIAVTKKLEPSAVKRNRIKRLIREVFRLNRYRLTGNFDMVVVARKDVSKATFDEVRAESLAAFDRAGLLG